MHKVAYGILFSYLLFEMRKVGQCRSRLGNMTDSASHFLGMNY